MKLQKTIRDPVKLAGKGLFGGQDATITFHPAPEETGVVFVRTDVASAVRIAAVAPNIAERSRRTSIKKGEVSIETVEHCLAAIHALEIDNILMEVEGPELPAPDCSSGPRRRLARSALAIITFIRSLLSARVRLTVRMLASDSFSDAIVLASNVFCSRLVSACTLPLTWLIAVSRLTERDGAVRIWRYESPATATGSAGAPSFSSAT